MNIHPNAYYNYLKRSKAPYYERKSQICMEIANTYHDNGGVPGHRTVKVLLARKGIFLSKTTVHKYMNKELRLKSICRRKRPGYKKGHPHKIFANLLDRNFDIPEPNRVWCTDFTYLFLSNGSVRFNCTIIDLYDRSVVASEMGHFIDTELAIRTLSKALESQHDIPEGLILHSDQGSQFTSIDFIKFCEDHGITQSMSKAGCPYDNAPMERYFNSLKHELINRYYFATDRELYQAVAEYAYGWYNQQRPHTHNGYLTPFEVRYKNG